MSFGPEIEYCYECDSLNIVKTEGEIVDGQQISHLKCLDCGEKWDDCVDLADS